MRSLLVAAAVLLVGCTTPAAKPETSYVRDVQPLIERSCQGCHTSGGVAPMAFETPEQVIAAAPLIEAAVKGGRMPPFFAAKSCNEYQNDLRLSDDEKALFSKWVSEGAPRGDDADAQHAEPVALPSVRADVSMSIGGAFDVRKMNAIDNYQCFVMDPGNVNDLQVVGYEITPGNAAVLHHLLAYVVPPEQVAQLQALDDAAPGLGYPCQSGGVGIEGAVRNQIAGWVPGQYPNRLPAGTALTLVGGSKLVVQVHYNLNALYDASVSPFDETKLSLELAPAGSFTPAKILPMLKPNLAIPAGVKNSVQTLEVAVPQPFREATVYRAMGHAHQLATQVKLEVIRQGGSAECVLDNPNWDFNWQRDYTLTRPITLKQGDKLRITCTYDNSPENQAVENGQQRQPVDVSWGESSYDEMCMTYLTFTSPK